MESGPQCHHARRHRDHARWPGTDEADLIAYACYRITYPAAAAAALDQYNALESAPVEKHGKKGNKIIELKEHLPKVEYTTEGDSLHMDLCLPAAQELNLNPSLLTDFWNEKCGRLPVSASMLRTQVYYGRHKHVCLIRAKDLPRC